MTRADRLFAAAGRWERRVESLAVLIHDGETVMVTACGVTFMASGRPMNRLDYRLWCLKHAKRCRTLGLRAMREKARQERLARYRADLAEHGARTAEQRWLASWERRPHGA